MHFILPVSAGFIPSGLFTLTSGGGCGFCSRFGRRLLVLSWSEQNKKGQKEGAVGFAQGLGGDCWYCHGVNKTRKDRRRGLWVLLKVWEETAGIVME